MFLILGAILLFCLFLIYSFMSKDPKIKKENIYLDEINYINNWWKTFDESSNPSIIIEKDGKIVASNKSAQRLFNIRDGADIFKYIFSDDIIIVRYYNSLRFVEPNYAPRNFIVRFNNKFGKLIYSVVTADRISSTKTILSIVDISDIIDNEFKNRINTKSSIDEMINVLISVSEIQDPYTAKHQKNVADLSVLIGKKLNLPDKVIKGIWIAGSLHDIGKIGLPQQILCKPTELNKSEFNLIKEHPKTGFEILKNVDFPWPIADIVLQHHERIDGTGYPYGIKGNDILIEAKIIAVADVVEAISSHRPYRPALGINRAIYEINLKRGILYDAEIADACIEVLKNKSLQQTLSVNYSI